MTDYDTVLDPSILLAKQSLAAAKIALLNTVSEAQKTCEHKIVGVCDYTRLEYFPSLKPYRICLTCRLEEEAPGSYSSIKGIWGRVLSKKYELDPSPTRIYVEMSRNSLMELRIR